MMNFFERLFRKKTVNEAKKEENNALTMTVEGDLDMQELMGISRLKVNLQNSEISWNRVPSTKLMYFDVSEVSEVNLILFDLLFGDTVCAESTLILASLIYEEVEKALTNKQKYANVSDLLTYSFFEAGHYYTPEDIEKALEPYCIIIETEDANRREIA